MWRLNHSQHATPFNNGEGPNTGMTPWNGKVHMRRTTGLAYTVEQGQKMNIVRTVPVSHWLRWKIQNLKTHSVANVQARWSSFLITCWKVFSLTKNANSRKRQNPSFYKLIRENRNERKEKRRREKTEIMETLMTTTPIIYYNHIKAKSKEHVPVYILTCCWCTYLSVVINQKKWTSTWSAQGHWIQFGHIIIWGDCRVWYLTLEWNLRQVSLESFCRSRKATISLEN